MLPRKQSIQHLIKILLAIRLKTDTYDCIVHVSRVCAVDVDSVTSIEAASVAVVVVDVVIKSTSLAMVVEAGRIAGFDISGAATGVGCTADGFGSMTNRSDLTGLSLLTSTGLPTSSRSNI